MESDGGLAPISEVVTPTGGSMTSLGRASRGSLDGALNSQPHHLQHHPHKLQHQQPSPQNPSQSMLAGFALPTSTIQRQELHRDHMTLSTEKSTTHSSGGSSQRLMMQGLQQQAATGSVADLPGVMSLSELQADSAHENWLCIDSGALPSGIMLREYDDSSLLGSSLCGHVGQQDEGIHQPDFSSRAAAWQVQQSDAPIRDCDDVPAARAVVLSSNALFDYAGEGSAARLQNVEYIPASLSPANNSNLERTSYSPGVASTSRKSGSAAQTESVAQAQQQVDQSQFNALSTSEHATRLDPSRGFDQDAMHYAWATPPGNVHRGTWPNAVKEWQLNTC